MSFQHSAECWNVNNMGNIHYLIWKAIIRYTYNMGERIFNEERQPTYPDGWEKFENEIGNAGLQVFSMIKNGEAYIQDEKDEFDNVKSFKVFANDGTLLFFKDVSGLEKYAKDFEKSQKHIPEV